MAIKLNAVINNLIGEGILIVTRDEVEDKDERVLSLNVDYVDYIG